MSVQIKPIVEFSTTRDDKKFEFIVPNGTSWSLAYDAMLEIISIISEEIEKERKKHITNLNTMKEEQEKNPTT